MNQEISFAEFCNTLKHPVQFLVSTAAPTGFSEPVHQDWLSDRYEDFDDFEGTVDSDGIWRWNGEGHPHDLRGNSILRIDLFESEEEWNRLLQDADLI